MKGYEEMQDARKTLIKFLLSVVMVGVMFPISAFASPQGDQNLIHTSWQNPAYWHLTQEQLLASSSESDYAEINQYSQVATIDEAAAILQESLVNRETSIVVSVSKPSQNGAIANDVFDLAVAESALDPAAGDYLMANMLGWNASIRQTTSTEGVYSTITYTPQYLTTSIQELAVDRQVAAILKNLNLDGKSTYDKLKAIHDWVCLNVVYDYAAVNNPEDTLAHSTYAAVIKKSAVCQGYSSLFYRLCRESGLSTRIVSGISDNESHSWNIVQIEDLYYNIDTTWDSYSSSEVRYDWFLKGSNDFPRHIRNSEFDNSEFHAVYPMSGTAYKIDPANPPKPDSYKVTFDSGVGNTVISLTVPGGLAITQPENPVCVGYRFVGWYIDEALLMPNDFSTPITSNRTIYAKWEPIQSQLSFLGLAPGSMLSPISVTYGQAIGSLPTPNHQDGITPFSHWQIEDMLIADTTVYRYPQDMDLHAYWGELPKEQLRLAGNDAFETMEQIVESGDFFTGESNSVIIATFGGYWDALSSSGLGGKTGAPVLLSYSDSIPLQTINLIKDINPTNVYICGGEAAISSRVELQLEDITGVSATRIAGATATETAAEVYYQGKVFGSNWSRTAFIATNAGYWDALAAAPYAYANSCPIFLSEGSTYLSDATIAALKDGAFAEVYILGGTSVIGDSIVEQLRNEGIAYADRLWGQTAAETSLAIANFSIDPARGIYQLQADGFAVATMDGFWDALSGAALCGQNRSPILLALDDYTSAIDGFVPNNKDNILRYEIFGGEAAISTYISNHIDSLLQQGIL